MSQCHVHSHLNLMSALLRQQVGFNAGWSSSIHRSLLPTMPVKPQHSIPSTTHRMQRHGDRPFAFCIGKQKPNLFDTDKRIRNLIIQRWTVPFYISARSSDVTLEAAEMDRTWRHCIEISMQRLFVSVLWYSKYAPVPSVYYDVIDLLFVIHWGITAAPHL